MRRILSWTAVVLTALVLQSTLFAQIKLAGYLLEGVTFGKGVIAVTYLKNASNVVEVFDLAGKSLGVIVEPVQAADEAPGARAVRQLRDHR